MPLFGLFGPPDAAKLKARRDVKGLIKALSYEKDHKVRRDAAEALVELGDARTVEPLIAALKAKRWGRREGAARALGGIGDARAVEPLIALLQDWHIDVREAVARALGRIGDARAVESLIASLDDEYSCVRGAAAVSLGEIGDARAVEPLIALLQDQRVDVRERAAWALGEIGDARAVEPLIASSHEVGFAFGSQREAARDALDSLGWKSGEKEIGLFISDLMSDDSQVRQRGFQGLKAVGDAAVEPLIEALENENLMLRRQAAEALGKINTPVCIQGLIDVFSDPRDEMFRRANYALWLIGEPAVGPLVEKLRDDDPNVRGKAAVVLGQMILRRRGDPSHRVWLDPSAIDVTDNLRDDINVRVVRSEAMGPLEELLQDEDASVREYASYALKKLRV